jgi:hypothetical protein
MAIAPNALATQPRRPAALLIPEPTSAYDDSTVTPAARSQTGRPPAARPLFSCDSVQRQQAAPSRACVDQWLNVMEAFGKRSCSGASSMSSLCSMDISTSGLAAADCPVVQQEASQLNAIAACPALPPPAFVVLGLLS